MSNDFWEEIEGILSKKGNELDQQLRSIPCWMDLTPDGKTLVVIYSDKHQMEIAEVFIDKLGEPELIRHGEENPDNLILGFPHQDLPEPVKEVAERMTTASQLSNLGYDTGKFI